MLLLLLACAPSSLLGDMALDTGSDSVPPADVAWLRLDPDQAGAITARLVGWNLGRGTWYSPEDGPTHPEWRSPELDQAYARLAQVHAPSTAPLVRFSGLQIDGSAGEDGYHFWDLVDPERSVSADDNVAVYEWMAAVEELAGEAQVTLNFGSGTAAEAAAYVTYLEGTDPEDPRVQARQHWGHSDPYQVQAYELGNESFAWWNTGWSDSGAYSYANPDAEHGGDPAWYGRPSSDAADYAERALEYVDAVLAVQPEAHFQVPVAMVDMEAWGGLDASISALAPLLEHPSVQAVVVHHYQLDNALGLGLDAVDDPELMVAGSALWAESIQDLHHELGRLERDAPLELAITEYHLAGFFLSSSFEHGDDAVVGLGLADMLLSYAAWGVDHVAQHLAVSFDEDLDEALYSPWFNPFRLVQGELVEMPSLQVTELIATHLRSRHLDVEWLQRPTLDVAGLAQADAVEVQTFGSSSETTVLLLNRDLQGPRTVRLELSGGVSPSSALVWAPDAWDQDCVAQPVAVQGLAVEDGFGWIELELPAHSLAGLVLE